MEVCPVCNSRDIRPAKSFFLPKEMWGEMKVCGNCGFTSHKMLVVPREKAMELKTKKVSFLEKNFSGWSVRGILLLMLSILLLFVLFWPQT